MTFRSHVATREIIAALVSTHEAETVEDALVDVIGRVEGAYSTVVMTKDRVVAFRDPLGLRPLVARHARRHATAWRRETCAFDIIGAKFLRDVQPGEIVSITKQGPPDAPGGPVAALARCASSSTSTSPARTPASAAR